MKRERARGEPAVGESAAVVRHGCGGKGAGGLRRHGVGNAQRRWGGTVRGAPGGLGIGRGRALIQSLFCCNRCLLEV